jgi:hypothetical protein
VNVTVTVRLPDLQSRGELHLLSWIEASTGPSSEAVWTCYCKSKYSSLSFLACINYPSVSDEVKGVGIGSQKASARQAAAKQALEVREYPNFARQSFICIGTYGAMRNRGNHNLRDVDV